MFNAMLSHGFNTEDFIFLIDDKIFTEKRENTDISNTVRKRVEKQKSKLWQT